MKFTRSLEFNCVPEWTEYYISYKALKNMIEKIVRAQAERFVQAEECQTNNLVVTLVPSTATATGTGTAAFPPSEEWPEGGQERVCQEDYLQVLEEKFIRQLQEELAKVASFFSSEKRLCMEAWSSLTESLFEQSSVPVHSRARVRRASFTDSQGALLLFSNSTDHDYHDFPRHWPATVDLQGLDQEMSRLYVTLYDLKDFLQVNYSGFVKILKKHDKYVSTPLKDRMLAKVELALPQRDLVLLQSTMSDLEKLYSSLCCGGKIGEASSHLRHLVRERLILSRSTIWQEMVGMERRLGGVSVIEPAELKTSWPSMACDRAWALKIVLAIIIFLLLLAAPLFADRATNNCFAMLVFVLILWCAELMPLFATAMLVPLLGTVLRVMRDESSREALGAALAAKALLAAMFPQVVLLLLGGFSIAAALTKYGVAKSLASRLLSMTRGSSHRLVFLVMVLGVASSMLISNVAAPVLCFSILHPLLRNLSLENELAKILVLAVAVSSNIGGMVSPISSPQNMLAIERISRITEGPAWLVWMVVSVPVCMAAGMACWLILVYKLEHKHVQHPPFVFHPIEGPFSQRQRLVVAIALATILCWCLGKMSVAIFGNMGIISVIPMACFFGTGLLTKDDFNGFLWNVIMLTMGGSALGEALSSSGLLKLLGESFSKILIGHSLYITAVTLGAIVTVVTSFVSHTVGALILLPLVETVGAQLLQPRPGLLVMVTALSCSAGMAMPISSFPNMNAAAQEDGAGRPYISSREMIKYGTICSIIAWLTIITIGYAAMLLVRLE